MKKSVKKVNLNKTKPPTFIKENNKNKITTCCWIWL